MNINRCELIRIGCVEYLNSGRLAIGICIGWAKAFAKGGAPHPGFATPLPSEWARGMWIKSCKET